MTRLPSKAQWLADTEVKMRVRSLSLRALDSALGAYEANPSPTNRTAVRTAFQNWKRHVGANWIKSDRNRAPKFPITALDRALQADRKFTEVDEIGIREMIRSRERRIQEVFGNAQITLRMFQAKEQVSAAANELKMSVRRAHDEQNKHNNAQTNSPLTNNAGKNNLGPGRSAQVNKMHANYAGDKLLLAQAAQAKRDAMRAGTATVAAGKSGADAAANAAFGSQIAEIRQALSNLFGEPVQAIEAFLTSLLAECGLSELASVAAHIADMLPFISLVSGGVKALIASGQAVYSAYQQAAFALHGFAIEAGAPAAAFKAVQTLLARQTKDAVAKLAIEGTTLAVNAALHGAKGAGSVLAPVVKSASATANAIRVITMFAIQIRETLIIRRLLKNPANLNLKMFGKAPLLGAYMLVGSNTSDLTALLFESFGHSGWQDEMEKLIKKEIHPVLDQCAKLIQSSPFIITGIPLHRATAGASTVEALLGATL
ncbi:MAG TPA: hypothetical protein PK677_16295 [Acidiphilium sp.]|nr:hypothetical protein [Acidiphilium sp.]